MSSALGTALTAADQVPPLICSGTYTHPEICYGPDSGTHTPLQGWDYKSQGMISSSSSHPPPPLRICASLLSLDFSHSALGGSHIFPPTTTKCPCEILLLLQDQCQNLQTPFLPLLLFILMNRNETNIDIKTHTYKNRYKSLHRLTYSYTLIHWGFTEF